MMPARDASGPAASTPDSAGDPAAPLIYVVAGEQSGDAIGARLIAALRARRPGLRVAGIGGEAMGAQGLTSLFPMRELALMGLVEILPRLRQLRRRLAETTADIAARRPAAVVTIDSPGFTLRLLRAIAPLGLPRAHYVAPQVWAWREGRVRHYPGLWDRLLCLLPFEPEFFARHHLQASFVGHPVLEAGADRGDAARFRARHALPSEARVLTLMPGSRRTETARLLPLLGATLARIAPQVPGLTPVVPLAGTVAETVRAGTAGWPVRPILVTDPAEKYDAFAASAAALTKSGTSTLELALARVPMLVAYRVNPVSAAIAKRLITVRYASLLNLLAEEPMVPEFIQDACTPDRLAGALLGLMRDPGLAAAQVAATTAALERLRPPGGSPSAAAAEAVLELCGQG
jgi:lipid-A-disaccharide synthase